MKCSSKLAIILCFLPTLTFAKATNTHLTFVNHTQKALLFKIGINPERLPDFKPEFTVAAQAQTSSQLLAGPEAYIRAEDDLDNFGFFGAEVASGATKIYGYLSRGLAFSWRGEVVTFCTPEDYRKNGHCV